MFAYLDSARRHHIHETSNFVRFHYCRNDVTGQGQVMSCHVRDSIATWQTVLCVIRHVGCAASAMLSGWKLYHMS